MAAPEPTASWSFKKIAPQAFSYPRLFLPMAITGTMFSKQLCMAESFLSIFKYSTNGANSFLLPTIHPHLGVVPLTAFHNRPALSFGIAPTTLQAARQVLNKAYWS